MIIYGIKSCDTVKKATTWLKENNIDFEFHDYKTKGISKEKLSDWCRQVGFEKLVNKKGTTWKALDDSLKTTITNELAAIDLLKDKTSIIKRPVLEQDGKVLAVGYNEEEYSRLIN